MLNPDCSGVLQSRIPTMPESYNLLDSQQLRDAIQALIDLACCTLRQIALRMNGIWLPSDQPQTRHCCLLCDLFLNLPRGSIRHGPSSLSLILSGSRGGSTNTPSLVCNMSIPSG